MPTDAQTRQTPNEGRGRADEPMRAADAPPVLAGGVGTVSLGAAALVAFAANSILCRLALSADAIDPAGFTVLRLGSGAAILGLLVALRSRGRVRGSWHSALALFAYAAGFSYAYTRLDTGTGALLLFGAVQLTMVGSAVAGGERPAPSQWMGLLLALAGLVHLVRPGVTAPSPVGAMLMIAAGAAWGLYSLRGRGTHDPIGDTAGNFLRAAVPGAILALAAPGAARWIPEIGATSITPSGAALALASGAITSGLGYVAWYATVRRTSASRAAFLQLLVPVLAAASGVALLSEPVTPRLVIASAAVLGGIRLALGRAGIVGARVPQPMRGVRGPRASGS